MSARSADKRPGGRGAGRRDCAMTTGMMTRASSSNSVDQAMAENPRDGLNLSTLSARKRRKPLHIRHIIQYLIELPPRIEHGRVQGLKRHEGRDPAGPLAFRYHAAEPHESRKQHRRKPPGRQQSASRQRRKNVDEDKDREGETEPARDRPHRNHREHDAKQLNEVG